VFLREVRETLQPGRRLAGLARSWKKMSGFRCEAQWVDEEWPFAQNLLRLSLTNAGMPSFLGSQTGGQMSLIRRELCLLFPVAWCD